MSAKKRDSNMRMLLNIIGNGACTVRPSHDVVTNCSKRAVDCGRCKEISIQYISADPYDGCPIRVYLNRDDIELTPLGRKTLRQVRSV